MELNVMGSIKILADLEFLGIYKIHKNSLIPHKSTKYQAGTEGVVHS